MSRMDKRLFQAGLVGFIGVVIGSVFHALPPAQQGAAYVRVIHLAQCLTAICCYALLGLSRVKGARLSWILLIFMLWPTVHCVYSLCGYPQTGSQFVSVVSGMVRVCVALGLFIAFAVRNPGRRRTAFIALAASQMAALPGAVLVLYNVLTAGQGRIEPFIAYVRIAGIFVGLCAFFGWLYLMYASGDGQSASQDAERCISWPWRVLLAFAPVQILPSLGLGHDLEWLFITPVGLTFGLAGATGGLVIGWAIYLAFAVLFLRCKRLNTFFWILGTFFLVAVLNIAGCGYMLKGIGG